MKMITLFATALLALVTAQSLQAEPTKPIFGELYYDGVVVRTVIPPAATPKQGRDDIYPIVNGVEGQLPVAAVGPGDRDYHGGKWAMNVVMWNAEMTPYLLTSGQMVLDAEEWGYVTIVRMRDADFKCPIQR